MANLTIANEQRLKPLLNGAFELQSNSYSDEKMAVFNRHFSDLEAIFGNSETFLTVVERAESITDVASIAVCELVPDNCSTNELLNLIANLEPFSDENTGYRSIEFVSDNLLSKSYFWTRWIFIRTNVQRLLFVRFLSNFSSAKNG